MREFRVRSVLFVPFFVANPYQQQLGAALTDLGVKVRRVRYGRFLPIIRAVSRYRGANVLHFHWLHPFITGRTLWGQVLLSLQFCLEILVVHLTGTKIVWTVHNLQAHESFYPRLERFFTMFLMRYCAAIIVHCNHARQAVAGMMRAADCRDKIHVIPHPSYVGVYKNSLGPDAARRILGLNAKQRVFLFFGHLRGYKGLFQLLDAFAHLECEETVLLVAGECRDRGVGDSLLSASRRDPRVHLYLRFIPDDEIEVFMKAADIVVLPFANILTSGSVMLGMSFGRAIVAPNMGCIGEVVDAEGGVLYDPNAEGALRAALRSISAGDFQRMGAHNLAVAKRLSWESAASMTISVYRDALR